LTTLATFSPIHLAIVAAVPVSGAALAAWARARPAAARPIRLALAAAIAAHELAWYGYTVAAGSFRPPHGLPLDLCDVVLWLTVYALATLSPWALDLVYYFGLAGSGMAILTPDVGAPFPSYPAASFFLAHGGVVAAILFLVLAGKLRPRPGSWWRALVWGNAYGALVFAFDAAFGTNYMYLREKPASPSLLDWLGPWPWYILGGEVAAAVLVALLYLPFSRQEARAEVLRRP
jgi:hypothetical integral membrane protein (TIGR02206 family)